MAALVATIPVLSSGNKVTLGGTPAAPPPSIVLGRKTTGKPEQKLRFEEAKGQAERADSGGGGDGGGDLEKKKDKGQIDDEDEEEDLGKDATARQARRLYAALTYTSDNEREAYRRNKTEQTRLNMVLEHIGIQRSVRSKDLAKDIKVMKLKSLKIEDRIQVATMQGNRSWTAASSQRSSGGRALTALSQLYRKDNQLQGCCGGQVELPVISGSHRHNGPLLTAPAGRSKKANSITFISESNDGDWEHRQAELDTPKSKRTIIAAVVGGSSIRGNASRYVDTSSTPRTPKTPTSRSLAGRIQVKSGSGHQQVGASMDNSPYRQPQTSQKQPLMAIIASASACGKKWKKKAAEANYNLDADIESVLNMRGDSQVAQQPTVRRFGAGSGFGLRRPANFDITNNRSEEDLEAGANIEEESLRSITSSARPDIDRLATPSSNALRGDPHLVSRSLGGLSSSAACIEMRGELRSRRSRREVDSSFARQQALHSALMREKSTMKHFEDKIEVFYKTLKGNKRDVGKRGGPVKTNHWDLRGVDEKLMSY